MDLVDTVPIGYKFHPTEEELVVGYLASRVAGKPPLSRTVAFADVYGTEPWNLLGSGRQEGYFFAERKPKSGDGRRVDRKAGTGHWTLNKKHQPVMSIVDGREMVVGRKSYLSFNDGRQKNSGWSMYEYEMSSSGFQRIVLCHVKRTSHPAVSDGSFVGQKRNRKESSALSATPPTLSKKPSWGSVAHSSRESRFDVSPPPPPMVVQHPSLLSTAVTPPERSLYFVDSPAANEAASAKIPAVDDGGGDLGIIMENFEASFVFPSSVDHGCEQMCCPAVDHSFKSPEEVETFLMSDDTFTASSTADTRRLAEIEADLMSDGTITAASTTRFNRLCCGAKGLHARTVPAWQP